MAKVFVSLQDAIGTWVNKHNDIVNQIGDFADLNSLEDSSLVEVINEVHDSLNATIDLLGLYNPAGLSTAADSVVGAINELDSDVGNRSDLVTLNRNTIVAAINELHDSMGTAALGTLATDIKGAINELHDSVTGIHAFVGGPNGPNGPNVVLDTLADSVVGAINELHDSVDQLNTFVDPDTALTTTASTVSGAINEHETDIGNMTFTGLSATDISAAIRELRTELGDHTSLTTTATNNVVAAINEINAELYTSPDGSGSNFNTTATTIEGAINEFEAALRNSTGGGVNNYTLSTLKQTIVEAINELHDSQAAIKTLLGGTASDTQILLRTTADSVVGAVNEVDSQMSFVLQALGLGDPNTAFATYTPGTDTYAGDLGQLDNNLGDKSSIRHAINDLQSSIDTIEGNEQTLNTTIGSLANLDDEIQRSSITASINSLRDSVLAIYDSLTVDNLTFNDNIIRSNSTDGQIDLRHGGPGVASEFTYLTIKRFDDSDTLITTDAGGSGILLADSAVTIQGNLRVKGTTTYVNTETVEIDDNILLLNSNWVGNDGEGNAGLEVNRGGTKTNAFIRWNETDNKWEATIHDDGTIETILTTSDKSGISGANINDDAITNAKLANMPANTVKVRDANSAGDPSDKAVGIAQILIGTPTGFASDSLSGDVSMTDAGVVTIGDDKVTYAKMQNVATANRVLGSSSANGIVSEVQVATNMIAADAVTYAKIQNVASNNVLLGNDNGAGSAIQELSKSDVLTLLNVADGANAYSHPNHTGDVTSTGDGATTIANDAVTYAKMQHVATANRVLGSTSANGAVSEVQIATGMISNDAVTYAKMQNVATANRVLGSTSADGVVSEVQVSNDMLVNNAITIAGVSTALGGQILDSLGEVPGIHTGGGSGTQDSTQSIFIGHQNPISGVLGTSSVGVGWHAGQSITNAANFATSVGYNSGKNNNGDYNSAFGATAMGAGSVTSGNYNTSLGYQSGYDISSGADNTFVGAFAGDNITTGADNVMIGYDAGGTSGGVSNNVIIGHEAGSTATTGDNNIIIGHNAQKSAATVSNEITLGDANITAFRIPGISLEFTSNSIGDVTAGNYLTKSGTNLNVNVGSTLLIKNSSGTTLKTIVSLGSA
jgi:hypothetical protein